jgi:hypothetical protein
MTVTGLFSAKHCKSSVKMAILQVCDDGSKIIIVYYTGCYATLTGLALVLMECGAILDVGHALQIVDPSLYQEGKNLLVRIAAMLTKMCLRSE